MEIWKLCFACVYRSIGLLVHALLDHRSSFMLYVMARLLGCLAELNAT